MLKVGITGSIDAGKTTLATDLYNVLKDRYQCCLVAEAATCVMHEIGLPEDVNRALQFEYEVLKKQLEMEKMAANSGADVVLIDRTLYDWLYFFLSCQRDGNVALAEKCSKIYQSATRKERYSCLIVCKPVKDFKECWTQYNIISAIIRNVPVPKLHLSGSRIERLQKAEEFIEGLLEKDSLRRG